MKHTRHFLLALWICLLYLTLSFAQNENFAQIVIKEINNRSKYSGTFDIYDDKVDRVRRLKLMVIGDKWVKNDDVISGRCQFRDHHNGEIVSLQVDLMDKGEGLSLRSVKIMDVKPSSQESMQKNNNKEYSDDEIRDFINSYLNKQAKFTGYFTVYDENMASLRKFNFLSFTGKIRRFGSLFISTIHCDEVDSDRDIDLDVTVQKKEQLKVKNIRITKNKQY